MLEEGLRNQDVESAIQQHTPAPSHELKTLTKGEEEHRTKNGDEVEGHTSGTERAPLDWSGPDDPDNPRNFPLSLRIFSTLTVTLLAFVSTFAASIYSASADDVSEQFNVSSRIAILPLSLFNLGLAFGPLIGAPLSETYGRKAVFQVTAPIFALFTLGAGFSQSAISLIMCRFFAGVFAAPAVSNASATIADITDSRQRGIALGCYYFIPTFGAMLGPLVGGFITQAKGWRWTQWVTLFMIITFYIPVCFTRETYRKTILQRRAKKSGVQDLSTPKRSIWEEVTYFATTLFIRPIHMLVTEPIVTLVCIYNGFCFGLIYAFVVAVPWIFEHYYGFDKPAQSLSFLGLIVGISIGPIPLLIIEKAFYQPKLAEHNKSEHARERFPPENRLMPAIAASLVLPAALFIFAWTAAYRVHWIVPIIFQGLAMLASLMIYSSVNLYMVDAYGPLYGASASGAAMLSRYLLSSAFPLFAGQMYKALGVGWATTLLGFCTLAMAPIPRLFWRFGAKIRARSRYELST